MIHIYDCKGWPDSRKIELEYFMRGAIACSSENLDWLYNMEKDEIKIFSKHPDFDAKMKTYFGNPARTVSDEGKVFCGICEGRGTKFVPEFDGYNPTGRYEQVHCDNCKGTGIL